MGLKRVLDNLYWDINLFLRRNKLSSKSSQLKLQSHLEKKLKELKLSSHDVYILKHLNYALSVILQDNNPNMKNAYERLVYYLNQDDSINTQQNNLKKKYFEEFQDYLKTENIKDIQTKRSLYKVFILLYNLKDKYGFSPEIYQALYLLTTEYTKENTILKQS